MNKAQEKAQKKIHTLRGRMLELPPATRQKVEQAKARIGEYFEQITETDPKELGELAVVIMSLELKARGLSGRALISKLKPEPIKPT